MKRLLKEQASSDLRTLRILRTAVASIIDKQNLAAYKKVDSMLEAALDGPKDAGDNRSKLAQRLMKAGARVK